MDLHVGEEVCGARYCSQLWSNGSIPYWLYITSLPPLLPLRGVAVP